MLIQTRYIGANIVLLIAGAIICLIIGFMAVMTAGFGADPAHDFRSTAIVFDLLTSLLSIPFYLAMFRWCGVGMVGVWGSAIASLASCLVTGMAGPTVLFTLLLGIQGAVCYAIYSRSRKGTHFKSDSPLQ
jgi:hypothetical protein